ncbi:MAG: TlpA disulfide reductase family protein [Bacteroidetes bacterium]|nr:TlpA disulfide reductase family protein [Bacteroidota bacterium]
MTIINKYLLLLLILPSLSFGQSYATVKLKFAASHSDSCTLKIDKVFIDEYNPTLQTKIDENECRFKVSLNNPTIAKLIYHQQSMMLFIEPNDALELTLAHDSLNGIVSIAGQGAEQNKFLTLFFKEFNFDFDNEKLKQLMLNSTADAFEMKLFEQRKKQLAFFNQQDKSKFSNAFNTYLEQTIRYHYFGSLLSYPITNANQSSTLLTVTALPEVMLDKMNSNLITDNALSCLTYRDFITSYIIYYTSKANGFNKFTDYNTSMQRKVLYAKSNLTPKTLTWYIANFLNADCDKVAPYTVKAIYRELSTLEHGGTYTQLLKLKCEARIKAKELPAKKNEEQNKKQKTHETTSKNPFEGISLKDLKGNAFNPQDIKGKVVFVDFWASWCGPCRQEFPYSKQLHERFTEKQLKNVVFMYISVDGNDDAWKKAVESIGMEGLLLLSPGDWSSPIVKYFGINSIPHYMLIDKNGEISNREAPRPSSGDLIYHEILKLLN